MALRRKAEAAAIKSQSRFFNLIVEAEQLPTKVENCDAENILHSSSLFEIIFQGETIFSLLSFIEFMGGLNKDYKTISAK